MEGPWLQGGQLVVAQVQFSELAQAGQHSLLKPPIGGFHQVQSSVSSGSPPGTASSRRWK